MGSCSGKSDQHNGESQRPTKATEPSTKEMTTAVVIEADAAAAESAAPEAPAVLEAEATPVDSQAEQAMLQTVASRIRTNGAADLLFRACVALGVQRDPAWPVVRTFLLGAHDPSSPLSRFRDAYQMRELICSRVLPSSLQSYRYDLLRCVKEVMPADSVVCAPAEICARIDHSSGTCKGFQTMDDVAELVVDIKVTFVSADTRVGKVCTSCHV